MTVLSVELQALREATPFILTANFQASLGRAQLVHQFTRLLTRIRCVAVLGVNPNFTIRFSDSVARFVREQREEKETEAIVSSVTFVTWLHDFLAQCLYPQAPHERAVPALELYHLLLAVWDLHGATRLEADAHNIAGILRLRVFHPTTVRVLLAQVESNRPRCRRLALEILSLFPAPLPGYESPR